MKWINLVLLHLYSVFIMLMLMMNALLFNCPFTFPIYLNDLQGKLSGLCDLMMERELNHSITRLVPLNCTM